MTIEALLAGIYNSKLGSRSPNDFPAALVNDLRSDATKKQWNATLLQIRDAKSYASVYGEYQLIEQCWTHFGKALEFSEKAAESQRDKTRFCASPPCEFYSKSSPDPLRVCTGCKQVYYCSQTCQKLCVLRLYLLPHTKHTTRSDWKAGHRTKCRELAKETQL